MITQNAQYEQIQLLLKTNKANKFIKLSLKENDTYSENVIANVNNLSLVLKTKDGSTGVQIGNQLYLVNEDLNQIKQKIESLLLNSPQSFSKPNKGKQHGKFFRKKR
jgi:hypothetical protein